MRLLAASYEKNTPADRRSPLDTQLHHPWLFFVRVIWMLLALLVVGIFCAGLPVYIAHFQQVCPSGGCAAGQLAPENVRVPPAFNASAGSYPLYSVVFQVVSALVWFAVGGIIFWRRSSDWMALLVALLLICLGTADVTHVLAETHSLWQAPALGLNLLTFGLVFLVFSLFPGGRLAPRWGIGLVILYTASALVDVLLPKSCLALRTWPIPLTGLAWFSLVACLVFVQGYRYQRISTPLERQQTKWIFLGVAAVVVGGWFWIPALIFPALLQPGSFYSVILFIANMLPLLIPLVIGFSVLRYRLWAIDTIINRVLVYSTLTSLLALLYIGCVVGVGYVLRGLTGVTSDAITLGSTILIAALFHPLRRRIQKIVNRRFYRHNYHAARILAAFSAAMRDEIELMQLKALLLAVVEETMRPEFVSLWLSSRAPTPTSIGSDEHPEKHVEALW